MGEPTGLPGISVRQATLADVPAIHRLVRDAYEEYQFPDEPRPMPTLKDYARQLERNPVWVAEDEGRIVGCLELIVAAVHVVVENLAVAPSHQNRRLGSWFMAFAERDARARGLREVRTYTRASMDRNVAIYQHLGYEVTARATTDGRARVFLRKRLD